jgi:hypothetical protein
MTREKLSSAVDRFYQAFGENKPVLLVDVATPDFRIEIPVLEHVPLQPSYVASTDSSSSSRTARGASTTRRSPNTTASSASTRSRCSATLMVKRSSKTGRSHMIGCTCFASGTEGWRCSRNTSTGPRSVSRWRLEKGSPEGLRYTSRATRRENTAALKGCATGSARHVAKTRQPSRAALQVQRNTLRKHGSPEGCVTGSAQHVAKKL